MPTYEYVCAEGHTFEEVQKMSDAPIDRCPQCGSAAERRVSGGAGLIFKGSGFYITDYGKDGKVPVRPPSEKASTDKPATKSESSSPAPTKDSSGKSGK